MSAVGWQWLKWVEPWYLVYLIMGVVIAGLIPVLLPLTVDRIGNAGLIGLTMAAVNLGGLTAPFWGSLADRRRVHRILMTGGLFLAFLSLAVFALTNQPFLWVLTAILTGLGTASAATVANLFIVEAHPQAEWDERIGWLQTFYGVGQVTGLLLAGFLIRLDLRLGLLVAAGLSLCAAGLGWLTTRTPQAQPGLQAAMRHPARHAESTLISPQRLFHRLNWKELGRFTSNLGSPYGIFILAWLLAFAGPAAVFSQYPILMQKGFGVTPSVSSVAFAIIAGLGLSLYTPAGKWSERRGPAHILRFSLGLRLAAFALMLVPVFIRTGGAAGILALAGFAFVVWAWSFMSVSGTDLAARLSPSGEGQGLGIFNAVTAAAGILGALLAGWAAQFFGYGSLVVLAFIGVALGLSLTFIIDRELSLRKNGTSGN